MAGLSCGKKWTLKDYLVLISLIFIGIGILTVVTSSIFSSPANASEPEGYDVGARIIERALNKQTGACSDKTLRKIECLWFTMQDGGRYAAKFKDGSVTFIYRLNGDGTLEIVWKRNKNILSIRSRRIDGTDV